MMFSPEHMLTQFEGLRPHLFLAVCLNGVFDGATDAERHQIATIVMSEDVFQAAVKSFRLAVAATATLT
jgi:hypothetical protein